MSKKFRRSLLSTFVMALVCVFTFTFVGCKDKTPEQPAPQEAAVIWTIEKAFAQAQEEGFTGTYEEFLKNLSSISDISLDDVGRLTFTLSNGTVIVAGTVTGGTPGRGIDSVEVIPDRWGLAITNKFYFSDGSFTQTEYTTSPMYGREYDVTTSQELTYLIEHGVSDIILANDIGSVDDDYINRGIRTDVRINMNSNTFYAKSLDMYTSVNAEILFENGLLQTVEGVDISAPRGSVSFANMYAFDEAAEFSVEASKNTINFDGYVGFAEGKFSDYFSELLGPIGTPETASIKVPASTRIYVKENATVALKSVIVEPVTGSKLTVLNAGTNTIVVDGDALVVGLVESLDPQKPLTLATVAIDEKIYADMNEAYADVYEGAVVVVFGQANWVINEKIEVSRTFTVTWVEGGELICADLETKLVPAVGYVKQNITNGFKFMVCPEHTHVEGYCSACGAENPKAGFVARVNGRGYLTFEKALEAATASSKSIVLYDTVDLENMLIETTFTVDKNTYELVLEDVTYGYGYYLEEDDNQYRFKYCGSHSFSYDYCTTCGHADKDAAFVAHIGNKKYTSIENIFKQRDHLSTTTVVVELDADATWNITQNMTINYNFVINKNGKNLTINGRYDAQSNDRFFFTNGYYVVDNVDKFEFKRCAGHNYYKEIDGSQVYTGYCAECGAIDPNLNTTAEIMVDGVKYESLQNLIDQKMLKTGIGTIVLQKPVTFELDAPVTVDFELYIDFHGKQVQGNLADWILPAEGYHVEQNLVSFKIVADTPAA